MLSEGIIETVCNFA